MEECSLVIQLPGNGDPIESKEPFQFNPSSSFNVYRLDAPKPLDVRTLAYNTKPPAKDKVHTVTPRAGEETVVSRFPCVWGSLHTFEITCTKGSDCLVDVWSSQNTTYGTYHGCIAWHSNLTVVFDRRLHVPASDDLKAARAAHGAMRVVRTLYHIIMDADETNLVVVFTVPRSIASDIAAFIIGTPAHVQSASCNAALPHARSSVPNQH